MDYCDKHLETLDKINKMATDVAVIKEKVLSSIEGIKAHVEHGVVWRIAIATIGFSLACSIVYFAFWCGGVNERVKVNTEKLRTLGHGVSVDMLEKKGG